MEGGWVMVDPREALGMLEEVGKIVSGEQVEVMRYGAQLLQEETARAFREQVDPETGRGWAPRKREYPWPLLIHTGALKAMTWSGWGIKTKSGRPRLFGAVRDGVSYGGSKNIVVAGAVQYGRSKHRTRRGTKKPRIAPTTGITPPRPFFGFGRTAQQKFAARYEQLIKKANV